MFRTYLAVFSLALIVVACSDQSEPESLLTQPPYNKITDSIRLEPRNADLYYRRGGLLYSNNQPGMAEQDLRTAWQLTPKEEYALSLTTVLRQKNTDSAILFLQNALQKVPASIALKIGLARGYEQKGQYDKALSICDAISAQYPTQLDALILKADILKDQDKDQEALGALEKAYSFAPFDKELAYNLAFEYAAADNPKALTLSDSLIKTDSTETAARAYYVKATYYNHTGNIPQAYRNYDLSIAQDYNFMDSYLDKGQLFYQQKKYGDALKTFELALKVSPTTAEFYFWIGKTQEAMGNKADAKLNYQRAYGLDKTMAEAKQAADRL